MTTQTVNVELFNKIFDISRKAERFDISDVSCCFLTNFNSEFSKPTTKTSEYFQTSYECFEEWYFPLAEDLSGRLVPRLPRKHFTDVEACVNYVKQVVEAHHGPQRW